MSGKRRAGPVRQLSLQPQHSPHSRRPLRKQQSEELWGAAPDSANSLAAGAAAGSALVASRAGALRPRPVKLAWAERRQPSQDLGAASVEVVARRCSGQPRPVTVRPARPANLPAIGSDRDRDSILYTRQQLAERLRRAWREREQRRPNLDIFLAHNSVEEDGPTPRTRPSSSLSAPTAAIPRNLPENTLLSQPSVADTLSPTIQRSNAKNLPANQQPQNAQPSTISNLSPTIQRNSARNLPITQLHNETQPSIIGSLSPSTLRSNIRNTPSNQLHHETQSYATGSFSPTIHRSSSRNSPASQFYNEMQAAPIGTIPRNSLQSVSSSQERNYSQTHSTSMTTTTSPHFRSPISVTDVNGIAILATDTSTSSACGLASASKTISTDNNARNTTPTVVKHSISTQIITSNPISANTHNNGNAKANINGSLLVNKPALHNFKNTSHLENLTSIKDSIVLKSTKNDAQDITDNISTANSQTFSPSESVSHQDNSSLSPLTNKLPTDTDNIAELTPGSLNAVTISILEDKKVNHNDVVGNVATNKKLTEDDSVTAGKIVVSVPPTTAVEDASSNDDTKPEDVPVERKRQIISEVPNEERKPSPLPAATRRVNFRNAGNRTAIGSFSGESAIPTAPPRTRPTPPLSRALSAPAQRPSDSSGSKGILVKNMSNGPMTLLTEPVHASEDEEDQVTHKERNIKSAPARRRLKGGLSRRKARGRGEESSEEEADEAETKEKEKSTGAGRRRAQQRGAEIVTMVSLMSPGASDTEDSFLQTTIAEGETQWLDDREISPGPGPARPVSAVPPRIVCLRKSPKSVSFQQPASYSASFPMRRGTAQTLSTSPVPDRDKRPPTAPPVDSAKRRLVRTKSAPPRDSDDAIMPSATIAPQELPSTCNISTRPSKATPPADQKPSTTVPEAKQNAAAASSPSEDESAEPGDDTQPKSAEPDFQTPKERECWQLYRRMCEKGVSVSYDTILRGMLTPTEYRLRKNALLSTC